MKFKIMQSIPALIAIAGVELLTFGRWCTSAGQPCYRGWLDQNFLEVVKPLYFFSLYFLPIAIVLIFIRRDIFVWWAKFSVLLFLFAFLYIVTTPVSSGGFLYSFTRDDSAQVAAVLVDLASVIFIIFKYRQARKIRTP